VDADTIFASAKAAVRMKNLILWEYWGVKNEMEIGERGEVQRKASS